MGMAKLTFVLDDDTVRRLRVTAQRLSRPQSRVVREAVADYAERVGRLSEIERTQMLRAVDQILARRSARPARDVDAELRALLDARRSGGRRSAVRSR